MKRVALIAALLFLSVPITSSAAEKFNPATECTSRDFGKYPFNVSAT